MKNLHKLTFILLIIGGLNWLLIGLGGSDWNLIEKLAGQGTPISMIIYILVGLSAVVEIVKHKSNCKWCGTSAM
ncbi:MAG: DUF378 domain-containing protein [Patescibacteria group bacterium]